MLINNSNRLLLQILYYFNPFLKIRFPFRSIKRILQEKGSLTFKFSSGREFFTFLLDFPKQKIMLL